MPAPYYVSSDWPFLKLGGLFASGKLTRDLRQLKFQILMVFRLQNEHGGLPPLNSKAIQGYCDALLDAIQGSGSEELFKRARGPPGQRGVRELRSSSYPRAAGANEGIPGRAY